MSLLKHFKEKTEEVLGQRPAAPEVPGGRLAGANGECTEPELGISYLGLGEKVPDCGPGPSTEARGVPPQDRHAHREPAEGGSLDQVLNAEGAAGELRDGGDPFQLDVEFAGNLERSVLPSTPGPERMCGDEDGRASECDQSASASPLLRRRSRTRLWQCRCAIGKNRNWRGSQWKRG